MPILAFPTAEGAIGSDEISWTLTIVQLQSGYQEYVYTITSLAQINTKPFYEQAVTDLLNGFKKEEKNDMLKYFITARDTCPTTYTDLAVPPLIQLQNGIEQATGLTIQEYVDFYGIFVTPEFAALSTSAGFPLSAT